jgi:spore coat polysaccharide biosynthesis protein SpsF
LAFLVERLRRAKSLDEVVIATTTEKGDDAIALWCQQEHVECFRGSEKDVLQRYLDAARLHHADAVVRVTGDCPLIDPAIVDQVVHYYEKHSSQYDYVSNTITRSYPRGLDIEIFSMKDLERAAKVAVRLEHREHVTLYMYEHPKEFSIGSIARSREDSTDRWTVDTEEDLVLVTKILEGLYPKKPDFHMDDVFRLLNEHPDWRKINAQVLQKPVR